MSPIITHEDEPFALTGILNPSGTPVDQSIFVSIYAIDAFGLQGRIC